MDEYDVAVIGSGPGGYEAAMKAAQMGADVCCIEKEKLGGVCLNWGCIPTKTLLSTSKLYDKMKNPRRMGLKMDGDVSPDIQSMMKRKKKVVNTSRKGIEDLFERWGVDYIRGRAEFKDESTLWITGKDEQLKADNIIIATGSSPMSFEDFPFSTPGIMSSDDILEISEIPETMLVVGAGVVGCEFATLFSELGCDVTVVEIMSEVLPEMDGLFSKTLAREFKKKRINVITGTSLEEVEETGEELNCKLGNGENLTVEKVLVSIGREYNIEGIGLDKIGVKNSKNYGIDVNDHFETSVSDIYAIGDVIGGMMLAHTASIEGETAVSCALGEEKVVDYNRIPSAVFTHPEIASVGYTEEEVKDKNLDYKKGSFNFRMLGKAHAIGEIAGTVKILSDKLTDEILGVHIIGPQASVLIHEAVVAMRNSLRAGDIAKAVHAHPTLSEAVSEASHDVYGESLFKPPK